uniref:Semaphorin-3C n=1 Tax=Gouania willdenowi TaxID=441366 RepID=A0A8C5DYH7_GOUWI
SFLAVLFFFNPLVFFCHFLGVLIASEAFEHYSISDLPMDYRILQMDEDQDRMYVGCKDHVLSMDINNITHGTLKVFWPASTSKVEECQMAGKDPTHGCGNFIRVVQPFNRTHLFMCGSGAYSPVCAYINRGRRPQVGSGKGRCSFNPRVNTVSVMLNQELFSGMYIDFMGTDAAIFRSLTRRNAVRTDQHNSKWLSEPIFIDAHLIPDGTDPNDTKLYFFLRERLMDNNGNTKNIHTMVARVCPNDIGGQRSLVNKWATFLKARMVCSVLEEDGTETYFDELESVFLLDVDQPKSLLVFGVFTSTSSVFKGSAVCVYNMADILTVFNGPFAHRDGPNFQWVAFQGRIPYPRPGTCPGGAFTPDIHTTKEFPDDVVTFIRNHPVMFNPIYPMGRRPLVVRTNADYKYTSVAVDQVMAADGNYQVLFLGTDKGTIQKVIVLPSNQTLHEDLILEELEVFKPLTFDLFALQQQLYASSEFGVSQVSLHRCQAYGSACADCCLARDPYCAWDGLSCSRFYPSGKRRSRRQDVMHGNPLTQCRGFNLKAYRNAAEMTQYGVRNNTTFLECLPKAPQASIRWLIQRDNDRRKEVAVISADNERVISTDHGLLIRSLQPSDQGMYYCLTTENSFKRTVAKIQLRVLSEAMLSLLSDKQQSPWAWAGSLHPKVLLEAFSPAESMAVQQYCKDRKQLQQKQLQQRQGPPPGPLRGDLAKLKPLLDRRKSRNRRHRLPQD